MSDPASTPLVIGDPVARTVTIHLREGFGDGTDGAGHRYIEQGSEIRALEAAVSDAIECVNRGEAVQWVRALVPCPVNRRLS